MGKWIAPLLLLLLLALAACVAPITSRTVTLAADGQIRTLATEALTVRDVLDEMSVTLDEDDRIEPAETSFVEEGMTIRVVRVEVRTESERREIPFERRTVRDASVVAGETRLLEPGVTGVEELTYRVTFEDGMEVERRLVRQATLQEPRTEVILIGAQVELRSVPITGTIAYVADHNAWVMRTTSTNQRRLTFAGDLDGRVFALSPDGSHVLFTRVPMETGGAAPLNTLWIAGAATADAEPVRLEADSVLWAGWETGCEVVPAGTGCRIAYATGTRAEGNPGWKAANDLWLARPRPSDGRLLVRQQIVEPSAGGAYGWWGTTYAWSPDGRSLAYARADEVGTVQVRGGTFTTLAQFPPYRSYAPWVWTPSVSWAPEGEFIATTIHGPAPTGGAAEDSPAFDIAAIGTNGILTAELVSEAGMWAAPVYAPQGDAIAFGRARSPAVSHTSGYDLYVMDRDGSDHQMLFPPPDEIGLSYPEIAWGPEGDQLVVVYQGFLYLIHVASGDVDQLTDGGGVTAVRWQGAGAKD